jgi:PAS domain S-box-containing protein
MMRSRIYVRVLGGLSIIGVDGGERKLPTRKTRAMAVYLAVHPGHRFPRAKLADLLWADEVETSARHSLRQALCAIRDAFGADAIVSDDESIGCREGSIDVDVFEFERLAGSPSLDSVERAERMYRGEFLDGVETGQPEFDEWLRCERERLREVVRGVFGQILVQRALDPHLDVAAATALRLIRRDPAFPLARPLLAEELGIPPDQETVALFEAICAGRGTSFTPTSLIETTFVLEQVPHCIVVTDLTNRIVGWSKAAEQEFGFTKDDMLGRTPTLPYAPARDQTSAHGILRVALARGKWSRRVKLLSKDARETYQVRTVAPLRDRAGRPIGAFGIGTPHTLANVADLQ